MAHLIKKIAMDRSRNSDLFVVPGSRNSFNCRSHDEDNLPPSRQTLSMLKSVFSRDEPTLIFANNEILKTEEFRVQSGPARAPQTQQPHQAECEIYDDSSIISYADSVTWHDVAWTRSSDEHRDASSVRNVQTGPSTNDEAFLIRPAPAILRPT